MAGELERNLDRGGSLDLDFFRCDRHILPSVQVSVAPGIPGVGTIDIKVFLVVRKNRQAPGAVVVMPDGDSRQSGLAAADDVPAGSREMHPIAERGDLESPVGVIGQDRKAAPGKPAADGPVVAPLGRPWDRLGQKRHQRVSPARNRGSSTGRGIGDVLWGEADRRPGFFV